MSNEYIKGGFEPIEDLEMFGDLEVLCDEVATKVHSWSSFARDTVGIQLVRAIDSVGANLVEGDARQSERESLHFFYIARASSREARYWLRRASRRTYLSKDDSSTFVSKLESVMRRLSAVISSRRSHLQGNVREGSENLYRTDSPHDDFDLSS